MKKLSDNSLAMSLYSLLTVLSTATVASQTQNYTSDSNAFGSDHSLVLPEDGSTFHDTLIIVGTLDGKLRALDPTQNGMIRWSTAVSEEPLLSSSLSSVQMMKEFTGFRLIPSLDGGLYQFSWDSIEALPLTADTLLSSSFKLNDGVALVGGKNIKAMGIDPRTGKVRYSCSDDGCSDSSGSSQTDPLDDILVLKRTQKIVRAVSERTGSERWNFSVGQHELNYLNGNQKVPHERIPEGRSSMKPNLQVSIPDGLIAGVQKRAEGKDEHLSNNFLWKKKFDTPVAAVWLLGDGMLEKLDLLKITVPPKLHTENENVPLMYYVGSHYNQLYIHPSDAMEDAVKSAIENAMSTSFGNNDHALVNPSRGRIIWKPYLATSASRTPAIVGKTELAIRKPLDYPFDNGHYFYGKLPSRTSNEQTNCQFSNTSGSGIENNSQQRIFVQLKKSFFNWWRELIILLFTIGFFVRQMFKYWYKRVGLNNVSFDTNKSRVQCGIQDGQESNESKSSQSSSSAHVLTQENFVSRYQCDFEHRTCLGKGAFGLVFHARNKLDDCEYAVKRIRLPNNRKARDKVMREAKVLATLDHPGIVRYYNSWFEEPPVEWQKVWDEKLNGDSLCPTLSSFPSLTGKSEEHIELLQLSTNDSSFSEDEENIFQHSRRSNSRKRLDTLTIENENSYEKVESMTSGADCSASFSLEFRPQSFSRNTSNNNGRKVNEESSVVVFEQSNSSNKDDVHRYSNSSKSKDKSVDTQSSPDNSPLHLLYIQMQLCCRESLKDWLNSNVENRDYSVSINIFKQLVVAVEYIHKKGHIHRDLKPSNILFALDGVVKVGDFGLVAASQPCVIEESDSDESKESSNQSLTGQVGTQLYMSPEQVYSNNYCSRVDIFSLGIIFFELFYVFKTQMERHNVLTGLRKRNIPESFREEMPLQSEFVLWLLAENPKDRPSAEEISTSQLFLELLNKLTPSPTSSC